MSYKVYIGIIVFLLLVLLGIFFYEENEQIVMTPKEAIEQGISQLRDAGNVTPEQENILRVQLAIADYIANYGEPPDSLESLVPRYFDVVPQDRGQPITYKRKGSEFELDYVATEDDEISEGSQESKKSSVQIDFVNPNTVEIEDFVYDPSGKRDPFQPFDFSPRVVIDESLPPLERYDVSQLRTAAILTDASGERFAMIEDVNGKGHSVRIGTRVGNKNGTVVSIDENQVNVLESITDFTGETRQNLVSIKLDVSGAKKSKGKSKRKR
jgi:Tfp pilus assembly protein PilP